MSINLEGVKAVAEQTRADFVSRQVTEDEIIEACVDFD